MVAKAMTSAALALGRETRKLVRPDDRTRTTTHAKESARLIFGRRILQRFNLYKHSRQHRSRDGAIVRIRKRLERGDQDDIGRPQIVSSDGSEDGENLCDRQGRVSRGTIDVVRVHPRRTKSVIVINIPPPTKRELATLAVSRCLLC